MPITFDRSRPAPPAPPPAENGPVASSSASFEQTSYDRDFPPLPTKKTESQSSARTRYEQAAAPGIAYSSASLATRPRSLVKTAKHLDTDQANLEPM